MIIFVWVLLFISAVFTGTFVSAVTTDSDTVDISAIVPGESTSGGGGGTTGSTTTATVVMTGWAFPNAKLTLLKDGAVSTTLIANPDGSFRITLNGLNHGPYQLSIFAEDSNGVLSSSHVINLIANTNQPYNFSNIIIPPTILVNPSAVALNESYIVSGYAPAGSSVEVTVPNLGISLGTTTANSLGYYQLSLTGSLPPGVQTLRARATYSGQVSLYSRPVLVQFYLPGITPIPTPPPQLAVCVDYNKDRRVNLIDFSILLFWFEKPTLPPNIDCNRDNVIDIKDFSILMYFWTG